MKKTVKVMSEEDGGWDVVGKSMWMSSEDGLGVASRKRKVEGRWGKL